MSPTDAAYQTIRQASNFPAVAKELRTVLGLPENYAELEKSGTLPKELVESVIIYRAIVTGV